MTSEEKIIALEARIRNLRHGIMTLTVGTCHCMTKTPEPKYHDVYCPYRRARDILSADDSSAA